MLSAQTLDKVDRRIDGALAASGASVYIKISEFGHMWVSLMTTVPSRSHMQRQRVTKVDIS